MKGLELSRLYYQEYCAPMLREKHPELEGRVAVGLVGEGSECFGFDDELSRDHDWGAALCLWLGKEDFASHAQTLSVSLAGLPDGILGFPRRVEGPKAQGRSGVLEVWPFYYRYIGRDSLPEDVLDWLRIPEENLAVATNGEVFSDPCGEFTGIRQHLLEYFPEELRLKKLAAGLAKMAQAGQYNLPRCLARKEYVAANQAQGVFVNAACSVVFLLNRRYRPFYKWAHRALRGLPILGAESAAGLERLVLARDGGDSLGRKEEIVEEICASLALYLTQQGLSEALGDFLLEHAASVQSRITHPSLRNLDIFLG